MIYVDNKNRYYNISIENIGHGKYEIEICIIPKVATE